MSISRNIPKIFVILLCTACGIADSFEKSPPSVILAESIFLDTNPDNMRVFVMSDSIVPDLKAKIIEEMQTNGITITQNYSSANVVLKIRTRFNGKVLRKDIPKLLHEETSFTSLQNFEPNERITDSNTEKTIIDKMVEDPSGMIIGFAIGAASSNPVTAAPLGMAIGSALNIGLGSIFQKTEKLTILDIEVQELSQKPIWYHDKRLHRKDEYSIRKYDYSEQTDRKTYKTRIIVHGAVKNLHEVVAGIVL